MKTETCIVVLGLDADKKPRAAKFSVADEKTVVKAAAAQGLKIGRPKTDEATELALRLVDGKIYASGKGLLPLVKAETYEQLLKLLKIEEPKVEPATVNSASTSAKPSPAPTGGADPWASITTGATVLCRDPKDGGWWPCKVTSVSKDGKLLTVGWAGFPTLKPFTVARKAIAILPPKG